MRESYRGHPMFAETAKFCKRCDQAVFNPNFQSMPLTAFEPMVHRVFSTVKNTIYLDALR
ncbi:hypothetical protein [Bradyrhizobium mercantei]|uniref:hypothetical protein n=1 Tax=Bradyrhizobium mercantei TaxID=1904807 RepID=UPI0009757BC8|nr:hypothetical protein [Bradyrhizobium mercantei]